MKPREPHIKKHIHRWVLRDRTPAYDGYTDWFTQEVKPAQPATLTRECDDCEAVQHAVVDDVEKLVPGYEAVCDFDWRTV